MDELIARALDTAQAQGAQYADVRLVRQERQLVLVRNGTVEEVSLGEDAGFGVRALVDGAWGFASSYRTDPAEADAVAGEAVRIARASARVHNRPVQLGEPVRSRGTYRTPVQRSTPSPCPWTSRSPSCCGRTRRCAGCPRSRPPRRS